MMGRAIALLLLFVVMLTAAREISERLCEPVESVASESC